MRGLLVALVFAPMCAMALSPEAQAGSITVANTTDNVAYLSGPGGGPTPYFDGGTSAVGAAPVGDDFATTQLAVTSSQVAGGGAVIDFQYTTVFSGNESVSGQSVYYPDIFLRMAGIGYGTAPFDYAISLGDEGANGGLAAGFYRASSTLTSQQIWSGRPGFIYGGQYASTSAYQPGQAGYVGYNAPTVLTAGTRLAGASVTQTRLGSDYLLDVSMILSAAQAALFASNIDVFWGTGDCANGSFLASIPSMTNVTQVPETTTLALFPVGLITLLALGRRARAAKRPLALV